MFASDITSSLIESGMSTLMIFYQVLSKVKVKLESLARGGVMTMTLDGILDGGLSIR
jgi:hypothetical protein